MKTPIASFVVGSCLAVILTACTGAQIDPPGGMPAAASSPTTLEALQATPAQTPAPLGMATPIGADAYVERAVMVVAAELNLAPGGVTVEGIESVDWPDAGLGCPLPGMGYAEVITPGYRVTLTAAGVEYAVHLDTLGTAIVCSPDGSPIPGSIPILPGERIMDGQPWMSVD